MVVVPKPGKPLVGEPLKPKPWPGVGTGEVNAFEPLVVVVVVVPKPGNPLFGEPLKPNPVVGVGTGEVNAFEPLVVVVVVVPKPGKPLFGAPLKPNPVVGVGTGEVIALEPLVIVVVAVPKPAKPVSNLLNPPLNVRLGLVFIVVGVVTLTDVPLRLKTGNCVVMLSVANVEVPFRTAVLNALTKLTSNGVFGIDIPKKLIDGAGAPMVVFSAGSWTLRTCCAVKVLVVLFSAIGECVVSACMTAATLPVAGVSRRSRLPSPSDGRSARLMRFWLDM
jgi:hypothetical protein